MRTTWTSSATDAGDSSIRGWLGAVLGGCRVLGGCVLIHPLRDFLPGCVELLRRRLDLVWIFREPPFHLLAGQLRHVTVGVDNRPRANVHEPEPLGVSVVVGVAAVALSLR